MYTPYNVTRKVELFLIGMLHKNPMGLEPTTPPSMLLLQGKFECIVKCITCHTTQLTVNAHWALMRHLLPLTKVRSKQFKVRVWYGTMIITAVAMRSH